MTTFDIILRLATAALAGGLVGLNRELHDKPTGVRTLGLVGLGSALAVIAAIDTGDAAAASRVMQGIVTGIGFLGAGVIVRAPRGYHIQGLTTAACTWLAAAIGVTCAVADWRVVVVGLLLALVILTFGGPLEKYLRDRLHGPEPD